MQKSHPHLQVHHEQSVSQANSFLSGFSIGLFVGAAGFYLYGTERGKKLRDRLAEEWTTAKEELTKEGVINDPDISFRDFFTGLMQKTFGFAKEVENSAEEALEHRLIAEEKSSKRTDR